MTTGLTTTQITTAKANNAKYLNIDEYLNSKVN